MDTRVDDETRSPQVPLSAILATFLKLGATSFGGGTSAWMHREVVGRRGWLSEENFLETLTVAQVMPGANPVNLAVYVGLRLRGFIGAALAGFGMIAPAFCIILLLGFAYSHLSGYPQTHVVLGGLACVGIAATLTMGVKTARRLKGRIVPMAIAAAIFTMVGVLRWPLVAVVVAVAPLSILAAWLEARNG
jgi:chromate transporter